MGGCHVALDPRSAVTTRRPASRLATRPCSTRAASSRSSSATSPATRRSSCRQVCGCTPEELVRVAELLCANSGRERTSAIVYAVGWTQHTTGVQMIRTAGILQLLLGNMGRPGGGIMAMRGHSTIQGSTDVPTLYDLLPGYLPQPAADRATRRSTPTSSTRACPPATGPTSASSSSACSRRGTATPPRRRTTSASPGCRASTATTRSCLLRPHGPGRDQGLLPLRPEPRPAAGPTPGCTAPACATSTGWSSLDWFETESAVFWKSDPNGPPPSEIKTEVFFLPAAAAPEKEGTPDQHPAAAPVARQGHRPARRLPLRRLVRLQPRQAPQAALRRLDRPQGPAAAEPHLGLRLRRAAAPARRHAQPDRGRAGPRKGPPGDQRLQARRDRPAHRPARACWAASPS